MKRRRVVLVLVTLAVCLGILVSRAMWEGRSALQRGDEANAAGDTEGAILWWRRAARWYLPLAPHVSRAYDRLEEVATAAEDSGELRVAIAAWTGVRSSVRATRSFYTPFDERLERADQHLAKLMAQWEGGEAATLAERESWHHDLLRRDEMPSVAWSIIALLGMALWIGSGFSFALRAVNTEDVLLAKPAAYAGAGVALGLVLWLTGLFLA